MLRKQVRNHPPKSSYREEKTPRLLACPTTRKEPRSRVTPFAGESDPHPVCVVLSAGSYGSDSRAERAPRDESIGFQAVCPVALGLKAKFPSIVTAGERAP